jgi:hypothetical protein
MRGRRERPYRRRYGCDRGGSTRAAERGHAAECFLLIRVLGPGRAQSRSSIVGKRSRSLATLSAKASRSPSSSSDSSSSTSTKCARSRLRRRFLAEYRATSGTPERRSNKRGHSAATKTTRAAPKSPITSQVTTLIVPPARTPKTTRYAASFLRPFHVGRLIWRQKHPMGRT